MVSFGNMGRIMLLQYSDIIEYNFDSSFFSSILSEYWNFYRRACLCQNDRKQISVKTKAIIAHIPQGGCIECSCEETNKGLFKKRNININKSTLRISLNIRKNEFRYYRHGVYKNYWKRRKTGPNAII